MADVEVWKWPGAVKAWVWGCAVCGSAERCHTYAEALAAADAHARTHEKGARHE